MIQCLKRNEAPTSNTSGRSPCGHTWHPCQMQIAPQSWSPHAIQQSPPWPAMRICHPRWLPSALRMPLLLWSHTDCAGCGDSPPLGCLVHCGCPLGCRCAPRMLAVAVPHADCAGCADSPPPECLVHCGCLLGCLVRRRCPLGCLCAPRMLAIAVPHCRLRRLC